MLLYSGPVSLFARKVEIALHEKRLTFDRVMVPFTQQAGYTPKHPVVLQHNPRGQVPCTDRWRYRAVRFHADPGIPGGRLSDSAALSRRREGARSLPGA